MARRGSCYALALWRAHCESGSLNQLSHSESDGPVGDSDGHGDSKDRDHPASEPENTDMPDFHPGASLAGRLADS